MDIHSIKQYGADLEEDDIIDIYLDLKEHHDLSFACNQDHYGKAFDVEQNTKYKLALSLYSGRLIINNISDF